ncbi:YidH family protein [Mumia quercus]|uniref:YidH family protein n=1 Tax=Mumia quercus TaxID=2976125 RepID=UPI0021CFAA7A|nr:DUF202 domain-containing protein [Mumia quercus]
MSNTQVILANERTYLAYVRTALALMAAGVAIIEFGDNLGDTERTRVLGAVIFAGGILLSLLGYLRWRVVDRRILANEDPPATWVPLTLVVSVGVFGAVVLLMSVF